MNLDKFYDSSWFISKEATKTSLISDIYTYHDKVYHGALGKAQPVIILIKPNEKDYSYVSIGFVHSFYEILRKDFSRISKKEWINLLESTNLERPSWINPILNSN